MLRITPFLITFIFILFSSMLQAKNIAEDYSVEFGIAGEVGRVHAKLVSDDNYYVIDANVSTVGLGKMVTNNLKERHISKGHVVKGLLVTDMYQMIKSYGEYTTTTIYRIDHRKKKLTRQYKKWKYDKLVTDKKSRLDYYSKDDMLTLFLNLHKHIKDKKTPKKYQFKAVGADRKNGRVDITIPSKKSLKNIQSFVGKGEKGDWYSTVVMHRKLYHSRKGELDVRIGQEGLVEKAVLKDLIFFGDVRIIKQ